MGDSVRYFQATDFSNRNLSIQKSIVINLKLAMMFKILMMSILISIIASQRLNEILDDAFESIGGSVQLLPTLTYQKLDPFLI